MKPIIIAAATADAAMRLAQRSDRPVDLGPASNPERAAQGWRRWSFARLAPVSIPPASPPREGIIDKVRKLLALSNDSGATEAEAANAAAAAQRLIEQHRLDTALLDTNDDDSEVPVDEEIHTGVLDPSVGRKLASWRSVLANSIAKANGCRVYTSGTTIKIVGSTSRVLAVQALYAYLAHEIERIAAKDAMGRGRSYAASWRLGCASRLGQRLDEAVRSGAEEAKRAAISRGVDIVRVEAALSKTSLMNERLRVENWMKAHGPKLGSRRKAYAGDGDAYRRGREAGDRIRLGGPRSLGTGNKLGGGR